MGQNKNKKIHSEKAEGRNRQNPEEKRTEREIEEKEDRKLEEYGQITLENNRGNRKIQLLTIIGEVEGKKVILVDDMIDTAGTICTAANILMEGGAKEVYACATHAVLSGPACERLTDSPFKEIIVTDTIPLGEHAAQCEKLRVASIAGVLAKSIRNIHDGSSVSALF